MINNNPILFFDSGIGGLTTLLECVKILPNEHYLYFADEDNIPYGNKNSKVISCSIEKTLTRLIKEHQPKIVVLACNTATALVLAKIRRKFKQIIFVGTEPAIVPAMKKNKKTLVLCTKNTKKHSKVMVLCNNYYNFKCVCPQKLAMLIEQNYTNLEALNPYLETLFKKVKAQFDCVVLGCTHYVFCKKQIQKILGNDVSVLDGNEGVANRVKYCVDVFNMKGEDGGVRFLNKGKTYNHLVCAYTHLLGGC